MKQHGHPLTTTIDGYKVELELDVSYDDNAPRTQCWVSITWLDREYAGSLEQALGGTLYDGDIHEIAVSARTAQAIEAWATANGY